jgi:hypothetical protein
MSYSEDILPLEPMNTTLNTLKTTPTHNTILPQRSSSPLSNHTRQHGTSRSHSLELHISRKLVVVRKQPDRLRRPRLFVAMFDNLLHFGLVKAFADHDGDGACGGGENGGEGGFCRFEVVAVVDYCFVGLCVSRLLQQIFCEVFVFLNRRMEVGEGSDKPS